MTKPHANFCSEIRNRHGEFPIDIAKKNKLKIIEAINADENKKNGGNVINNPFCNIEKALER